MRHDVASLAAVTLSSELTWRGLVHQVSDDGLLARLDGEALTAYIGFDPTADSLHLGNLLMLCNLRRLQEAGHAVIALAGGGTGMIGDPGGRSEERSLLTRDQLEHNLRRIEAQLDRFVDLTPGRGRASAWRVTVPSRPGGSGSTASRPSRRTGPPSGASAALRPEPMASWAGTCPRRTTSQRHTRCVMRRTPEVWPGRMTSRWGWAVRHASCA